MNDVAKAAAVMSLASPLLFTESASAAQEMMTVADGRAGILLFPLAAALGWVLFNIAGPTKNQIDDMNKKSGLVGAGLASLFVASQADAATEVMTVADGRAGILLFPLAAALGWVLFNIAGPTKNQIDNMSKKSGLVGAGLASLFVASQADAATEVMTVADGRAGILLFPLAAALGWVLFNIAGPTKNQIDNMSKKSGLVGAGLASLFVASQADAATEVMTVADGRAGILAFPVLAALGWVLFNIAGPTKNQIDNMSNK